MFTSDMSLTMTAIRMPVAVAQRVIEKRRLAGAEEAGQDGDGQSVGMGQTLSVTGRSEGCDAAGRCQG